VILERYLNTIYFGRGTYGVQAAARQYFNKDATDLDVAESAFLAAVIRSPANYDPDSNPEQAESRWNFVLDGMVAEQVLPAAEREGLAFPRVRAKGVRQEFAGTRGYLLETVRQQLYALGYSETDLDLRGLEVTSTFNRENQRALVSAVNEQGPKGEVEGVRVGAVSVRPGTGEIVALYGGEDYLTNQLNNATQATAMAGSTFKPFALAAALENDISLQSKWDGRSPRRFFDYRVRNYGNFSYKLISLLQATVKSVNTVYVALGLEVGPGAVRDVAVRAGLPSDTPGLIENATIVLGSASPTALNMANAYATFAAGGVRSDITAIKEVKGANGGLLYEFQPRNDRVFQADVMADLNFAMVQAVNSGTGAAASVLGHQVAGKTGTTDDDMSAWFVGYTPELATAVNLSRQGADGAPISLKGVGGLGSVTGGTFPARIWGAYMKKVLSGRPSIEFAPPANIGDTTITDEVLPDEVGQTPEEGLFPETTPEDPGVSEPVAPPSVITPPVEPVVPLPVTP
jgi:membrane peptidoglycan carboxypeptidase